MLEAAPPTWGWTLATFASYVEAKGCPACVGMDPEEFPHDPLVFGSVLARIEPGTGRGIVCGRRAAILIAVTKHG